MANLDIIRGRQVILTLTNRSGGAVNEGDVVIVDTGNDESFTTTVVVGNILVVGVVQEDIANLAAGRVLVEGYAAIVEVNDATARGDFLKTSGVATRATSQATIDAGVFARALTATVGAGQVSAELFGVEGGPGGGADISARAYHDASQSIPNVTPTILAFNSERFDTDVIHDLIVNNSRLTCQTAGKYYIGANVVWEHSIVGDRVLEILLNGATVIAQIRLASSVNWNAGYNISTFYVMAITDFVEIRVYQESGGALNVMSTGNYSPEFWMAKVLG